MKKARLLIFSIFFIFTFVACSNTDVASEPTEQQIWLPYTMLDNSENCIYTYYYGEYGNNVRTTKEDLNGNLKSTWLYEYDDNQNLTKRSVDTGDGTLFVQLVQTYDNSGRLIEKREYNTNSEYVYTYQYDEQNRLVSTNKDGEIIETYTYEADGSYKLKKANSSDEYSLYGADGKIRERHLSSDMKWIYYYNENGILVECSIYSGEDITRKTVYHLDENGNAVKITQVSASGTERVMSEYEFKQYTVTVPSEK